MPMQPPADEWHIMPRFWIKRPHKTVVSRGVQLRNWLVVLLLLCAIVIADPTRLAAQTTSIIQGAVTDQQHLALVDAAITLSSPVLSSDIEITTDATGSYRIPGLQAGIYNLQVSKPGFADKVYHG